MSSFIHALIGPRVPDEELRGPPGPVPHAHRSSSWPPACLLLVSIFFPYWHMELEAPQYPNGLFLTAYVNHLTGDVRRSTGSTTTSACAARRGGGVRAGRVGVDDHRDVPAGRGAALIHSKWAVLLAIPAITFPVGFSPTSTTGCGTSGST
jgi:hypothetical protein